MLKFIITFAIALYSFFVTAQVQVSVGQTFTSSTETKKLIINTPVNTKVKVKYTKGTRIQLMVVAELATAKDIYQSFAEKTKRYHYTAFREGNTISLTHHVKNYILSSTDRNIIEEKYELVIYVPSHIKQVSVNEGLEQ